jgi:hypothetical protein
MRIPQVGQIQARKKRKEKEKEREKKKKRKEEKDFYKKGRRKELSLLLFFQREKREAGMLTYFEGLEELGESREGSHGVHSAVV